MYNINKNTWIIIVCTVKNVHNHIHQHPLKAPIVSQYNEGRYIGTIQCSESYRKANRFSD